MPTTSETLINRLQYFYENPGLIINETLNLLEENIDGIDIVDTTNPFLFLLEAAAVGTHAAMVKSESGIRQMYPKLAQNNDELFYHLSDQDYYGIYSTPAKTNIKLLLNWDQMLQYGEFDNLDSNIQYIMIPKDSFFTVTGYTLGIHYPILITIYNQSKTMTARWVTDVESPLQKLTTNMVEFRKMIIGNGNFVEFTIPVEEFNIETYYFTADKVSTFTQSIPFNNKYMYARVWYLNGTVWEEMSITHNRKFYDSIKPTMIISVDNGNLLIKLPDIYQYNFNITTIRVDLYTTHGELAVDLANIPAGEYQFTWNNINEYEDVVIKEQIATLQNISNTIVSSLEWLQGGTNGRTYGQIKEQIIYQNVRKTPILTTDITQNMTLLGYRVNKYLDNVTDKVFVASKEIPGFTKNGINRTAFAKLNTVIINPLDENYAYAIIPHDTGRTTITPDIIFRLWRNQFAIMDQDFITAFNALDISTKMSTGNEYPYFYTPFFYIIDQGLSTIKTRAYIMDSPRITAQFFVNNTPDFNNLPISLLYSKMYLMGTNKVTISLIKTNNVYQYKIDMITNVTKEIPVDTTFDIAIRDIESGMIVSRIDTLTAADIVQGKLNYSLLIDTNMDIDQLNQIMIKEVGSSIYRGIPINSKFELIYTADIDGLGTNYIGTTEEIDIEFGKYMEGLYIPTKALLSEVNYEKWETSVPLKYTKPIYKRDNNGQLIYTVDNGEIIFEELHSINDDVLDENNNIIYKYKEGDLKTDINGDYIIDETNSIIQVAIGLVMISAYYKWSNEPVTNEYYESIPGLISRYLETEIVPNDKLLNERTDIFYKPNGVSGNIRVATGNGLEVMIPNNITFNISVYMSKAGFSNFDLKKQIAIHAKNIIHKRVKELSISIYDIATQIRDTGGKEIYQVDIEKFGPNKDIPVMRITDDSQSFSIKDKLTLLPGNILDVDDDIEIVFIEIEM